MSSDGCRRARTCRRWAAFGDLHTLELAHVAGVDLTPLTGLGVKRMTLIDVADLDLGPLAEMALLDDLFVLNFDRIRVPRSFGPSLARLAFINDDPDLTGEPVRQAVETIDWSRLSALQGLDLRVGGLYQLRPIAVDLGFLRSLPALEYLDLHVGVHHRGPGPSPIEPPFQGLSKQLAWLRIDADKPGPLLEALCAYLGIAFEDVEARPSVYQRYPFEEPKPPWAISELPEDGIWITYGSFAREERGAYEDTTEYDALRRVQKRLRAADAALLRRLDFDPENAGTGISAGSREDLAEALRILGLPA